MENPTAKPTPETPPNLEVLLDIPVKVSVELGSTQLPMREVLLLASGSLVQLDKLADAPVDLYVNQKLVARGEVVVVEDHFGIKVTEVVNKAA
jgi:flagellar motor switch protein FliN